MSTKILSPLPGTFYRRPSPEEPPFVEDGSKVVAGDVIGLVEVMKSFHEIRSQAGGANIRFLIANGDPVTAGAVLAEMD